MAGATALVVRNATAVTHRLIDAAPALRVVGRLGSGLDNIDTTALTERGIRLLWTPGANAAAVAEYTMLALLLACRPVDRWAAETRRGGWLRTPGRQLAGQRLAVLGYGHVGREVVRRAVSLDVRVRVYDRRVPAARIGPVDFVDSAEEAATGAHFLSIHLPLNDTTRCLVDARLLATLAPAAHVINTSRGGILDEAALLDALDRGQLGGAFLDVRQQEPPAVDDRLLRHPHVRHTPHVAGLTHDTARQIADTVLQGVATLLNASNPA